MGDRTAGALLLALPLVLLGSCEAQEPTPGPPEPPVEYAVDVSGERFTVRVVTREQVDAMEARLASGEEGVLNGALEPGDGGFNAPWSWHMTPASVEVPDMAIEVCDGRPSMVEADLDYWLDTVDRFCPWGAVVTARSTAGGG